MLVLALAGAALLGCQPRWLRSPLPGADTEVVALADPGVLVVGDTTYVAGTNRFPDNIPLLRSAPGTHTFTSIGDALPTPPSWARTRDNGGAFWAPSLALVQGRYILYFAARHRNVSSARPGWCIGTATADDPAGPYTPTARPLLCAPPPLVSFGALTRTPREGRGAIDPQVYRQGTTRWLHFKALDHSWQLWGVRLSPNGLALKGSGRGLVQMHSQEAEWEYSHRERFTVLENPSMDFNPAGIVGARHYLYYSGGDWQSDDYGTGIAACRGPMGPCLRTTNPAFLSSRGRTKGPGGLTVVRDAGGRRWAFHHAWFTTDDRRRVLHVEPLGYDGITPVILSRRPVSVIEVHQPDLVDPALVRVQGLIADRDRPGAEVAFRVELDGTTVHQTYTVDGAFVVDLEELYGPHEVCVSTRDDFRLGWARVRCESVDGGSPPPPPPPAEQAPTTTAPPVTTTTAPTTTAPAPPDTPPPATTTTSLLGP